jgi:hypothetical protein
MKTKLDTVPTTIRLFRSQLYSLRMVSAVSEPKQNMSEIVRVAVDKYLAEQKKRN